MPKDQDWFHFPMDKLIVRILQIPLLREPLLMVFKAQGELGIEWIFRALFYRRSHELSELLMDLLRQARLSEKQSNQFLTTLFVAAWVLFFFILSPMLLIRLLPIPKLWSIPKRSLPTEGLYCFLPEDWRNNLEDRLQRLKTAGKPESIIRREAIKCLLELLWAAVQITWENLWLPKNKGKGVDK